MKKIFFTFIFILFLSIVISAKDIKESKTKMDVFSSRTGVITKFIDYKMSRLETKSSYGFAETRIRKFISGGQIAYFYQIESEGKYGSKKASIAYEDLLEIIKAIKKINKDIDKDIKSNPDYLENKFVTDDGFQVGYYVSEGKSSWYLVLEKYGTDNTVFMKDFASISTAFNQAKQKIEKLMKK
ncbi:hypothetical protein ACFL2K_01010 [Candidatus Margulisiibacteriota bacterium]